MIIKIGYRKIRIFTDDGRLMRVREILTQQLGEIKAVKDFAEFEELETVEFVFRWWTFKKRISIPPVFEQAILTHLRLYHAKRDLRFDCYAFANLIKGMPGHRVRYMARYWDMFPIPKRLRPGNIVFLVNTADSRFYHAAAYLGMGLYLSVWGAGGDIEVATLQDMKTGFNAREVFLAVPRKR